MKKFFDLQLFAEGAGTEPGSGAGEGTGNAGTEPAKEPAKASDAPKYTDKDLDEIINKRFAKWQKEQQKAVDEAKKLAEMNAQQKAEYERDELQKQLADYKRKESLAEMTKTARKMLSDGGISVSDELLAMMVNTNAEETKAAIEGFSKAFNDAVENAVKARLKGEPPKRGATGGAASMTKEQVLAIKDPELRQQKMLENRELFNF